MCCRQYFSPYEFYGHWTFAIRISWFHEIFLVSWQCEFVDFLTLSGPQRCEILLIELYMDITFLDVTFFIRSFHRIWSRRSIICGSWSVIPRANDITYLAYLTAHYGIIGHSIRIPLGIWGYLLLLIVLVLMFLKHVYVEFFIWLCLINVHKFCHSWIIST